ncbi:helix-turn-helix domain-containing protein [Bacillus toyonensis]|uniref:XRE family transcriptional regulator n=2 Tax=Bacillus toyonensis TaxID=155322 RepID=A0A2B6QWM4_9BACI|nr:helix-turn-helix transcriptional regulator [Bacillus toyonensis]MED3089711.1 helix-turn-helix transcriptional regulator [Bacillus toyonensis]PEJ96363.1 XRE family transcriptional regulator [Bacillus toyonensis]PEK84720.1 XRE family transcriptional regulator [Bacillus toyonensis]PEL28084.1 XRE family transcriptional regulator [Bacillus toyonensis]PEO54415.1 XRE family transcriptional regulator [Bacillus toyonensis]
MSSMVFTLGETLEELGITKNKLAVEAKIRPTTISNLVSGEVGSIRIDTLLSILDTLNNLAIEKGINKIYKIEDVVQYIKKS